MISRINSAEGSSAFINRLRCCKSSWHSKVEPDIKKSSPIPRVGAAGELKGVAVFLAADASNYITGQTIVVDGGRTIAGH